MSRVVLTENLFKVIKRNNFVWHNIIGIPILIIFFFLLIGEFFPMVFTETTGEELFWMIFSGTIGVIFLREVKLNLIIISLKTIQQGKIRF